MPDELSKKQIALIKEAFDMFDKDGDGKITITEIASVIESLGEDPTDAELQEMMKQLDKDGDGVIIFKEFIEIMKKRMLKRNDEETDEERNDEE